MHERRRHGVSVARVVHEHHQGDGQTPQRVQRADPGRRSRRRPPDRRPWSYGRGHGSGGTRRPGPVHASLHWSVVLRLVLPKGSLEKATFDLFEAADLTILRSSTVDYKAEVDDPRIDEVRILRPQEIPLYVAEGLFDLGITGRDWIEETASEVESLGELRYSKASSRPVRVVLAVAEESRVHHVRDLPAGVRVSTQYPALTRRFLTAHGVKAEVRVSHGATEAKIPEIADAV